MHNSDNFWWLLSEFIPHRREYIIFPRQNRHPYCIDHAQSKQALRDIQLPLDFHIRRLLPLLSKGPGGEVPIPCGSRWIRPPQIKTRRRGGRQERTTSTELTSTSSKDHLLNSFTSGGGNASAAISSTPIPPVCKTATEREGRHTSSRSSFDQG